MDQIDIWIQELSNTVGEISRSNRIYQALDQRRNLSKVQNFLAANVDNRLGP